MVKWLSIFLLFTFIGNVSYSQKPTLVVQGTVPNLYILHTVKPKQNFYSIGRLYNVAPKELAAYNNLQFENGLSVGQPIKIPLTANNFTQSENENAGEALIPLYHIVQPKEGLYRVSINYNKVLLSTLKKWNNLKSDAVSSGTPLIIGYLKVNKAESAFATGNIKADNTPVEVKPEAHDETVKASPQTEQMQAPVVNTDSVKQQPKDVTTAQTDENKITVTTINTKSNINFSGGFFKNLYDDQSKKKSPMNEAGNAGIFKSTSGWQDGKYYCFSNDAPSGTVIKITDNETNKSVYAKVLDVIPDIKQNSGLNIIVSNAAAEELGSGEKFSCELSYVK